MKVIFKSLSAAVLLFVSSCFGYMGQPTEMGLAILAGALGLAFSNINKFSEFSGAGFSAKMKNQIQAVVDKETETNPSFKDPAKQPITPSIENSILKALSSPKYTWRTLLGISKDANCSEPEAWTVLVDLASNKFVQVANKNKTGEMIWALTSKGRQLAAEHA